MGREEWERVYDQRRSFDRDRFQEVYSDDDDGYSRGGIPASLASQKRSISDEYYFAEGRSRYPVRQSGSYEDLVHDDNYMSSSASDSESYDLRLSASQQMVNQSQEALAQKALSRIRRAKAKGKPNVTLSHEELEALESRRSSISDSTDLKRTPPTKGSPARSTTTGVWTRRRSKSKPPNPSSSSSVAPSKHRQHSNYPAYATGSAVNQQAFMLPGPGGTPFYSPLAYYDTQPPPPPLPFPYGRDREYEDHQPSAVPAPTRKSKPPPPSAYDNRRRDWPSTRKSSRVENSPAPAPMMWGPEYWQDGGSVPVYATGTASAGTGTGTGTSGSAYGGVYGTGIRVSGVRAMGSEAISGYEAGLQYPREPSGLGQEYGYEERREDEEESSEDELQAADTYERKAALRTRR